MARGGHREGAGRPKGTKNPETIQKEAAAAMFRDRVAKNVDRLFNAQLDLAVGEKYLMVTRTIGSGTKQRRETDIITDLDIIKRYLDDDLTNSDEEYYFMSTKPANNSALEGLLNRAFGKAKDSIDITTDGKPLPSYQALLGGDSRVRTDDSDREDS